MRKFLSIPVTNEQSQLVPANGVVWVNTSTTTTTIYYLNGTSVALTHASISDNSLVTKLQDALGIALRQPWHIPSHEPTNLPAISAIA